MIYLFDTSAINELHNDPERQSLVTGLLSTNNPRISALNVIEAVGTKDAQLRRSLVTLLKTLSHGFRPLATPNTLLKVITNAYERNEQRPNITSPEEEDSIWMALNSPDELDEETRQEVLDWKSSLEGPFKDAHREARPQLQALFNSGEAPRPRSTAQLIRYYRDNDELVLGSLVELYEQITSRSLSLSEARTFLRDIPYWSLYYAGWAHSIFTRAIREQNFGVRGKPGAADFWFAIYLPDCDVFVTHDKGQKRALRFLNVLNPRRAKIMSYSELRMRLLVSGTDHSKEGDQCPSGPILARAAQ